MHCINCNYTDANGICEVCEDKYKFNNTGKYNITFLLFEDDFIMDYMLK